jgi:hypothetical protein
VEDKAEDNLRVAVSRAVARPVASKGGPHRAPASKAVASKPGARPADNPQVAVSKAVASRAGPWQHLLPPTPAVTAYW